MSDIPPLEARLVRSRMQSEGPLLYDFVHRADFLRRSDMGEVPH